MDIFTILMFAAFAAVLVSLSGGILSMINGGEIGHKTEEQWMGWRVASQGAALVFILLALLVKG